MKTRAGKPTTGTQAAAGTNDSLVLPRIIIFDPPVRPCLVTNHCLNDEILVKINTETDGNVSETFTTANGLGHFIIPPKVTFPEASRDPPQGGPCQIDVSQGGQVQVHSVSFCTTDSGDDLANVSVIGWSP